MRGPQSSSGAEAAGAAVASAATASSAGGAVNALASADPGAIWECIGYNPYTLVRRTVLLAPARCR